jgi:ferritin-like metal-binding protein YciE
LELTDTLEEPLMPTSLRDLFIAELQDLYAAEGQIMDALPWMSAAATSPNLKRAFDGQMEQTHVQRERLELIFNALGVRPGDRSCAGMEGLINEGRERLRLDSPGDVDDAALIAAAQRLEHYEIAGYGTAHTYARVLRDPNSERLLQQTLDEEIAADHQLTDLAMSGINQAAESRGDTRDAFGWSRLRYLDVNDLDDSAFNYRDLAIRNRSNEDLGALDGLIVSATGRPLYYVVDSGGWFVGRRYLIPVGQVSFEATRKALVVDLDRDTIGRYPEFSTAAFMAMSDDEVRRYERRVLHTISPAATTSIAFWEAYERLAEYTQPDWLRPLARPRGERPIGSAAVSEPSWRRERPNAGGADLRTGKRVPVGEGEAISDRRPAERVVAQQDAWVRDPFDNTRDDTGGQPVARDGGPQRLDHDDDLAR